MSQVIKASGSITSSGTVVMPTSVKQAMVFVSGLSGGSILVQIADSAGTYVTEQENGTITADGRYVVDTGDVPVQIQCVGSSATGPATVEIVGVA
jgi:hypothetical protein